MTVIDYSWGNPTAELIGYLYRYREYLTKLDIFSLLNYAIEKLNKRTEFSSEHEIFCYIRMYNIIDEKFSAQIENTLKLAICQLINVNEEQWTDYVPMPLKFIEFDSKNFFGIDRESIDENLDYLIAKLEENKKILPTWEWNDYLDEWEVAKTEWIGKLTLEGVLDLKKFNRINIEQDIEYPYYTRGSFMEIGMEFRKLNLSDLKLVVQMENSFRSNFIVEENARVFLSNPMNWIFACIQDEQIIGFAYGYELNRLDNKGNMLYIHEVGVLHEYQRQGIGFQILSSIKSICKLTGICRFFLFTQKHNIAACALYEKAGGEKTSNSQDDDVTYFFNKFN